MFPLDIENVYCYYAIVNVFYADFLNLYTIKIPKSQNQQPLPVEHVVS